jgi:hypothetical protein
MNTESDISRQLAPEDIREDDYVAVIGEILQIVRWDCAPAVPGTPPETAHVLCFPFDNAEPLRVVSVCLPFVLVVDAKGGHRTLDARQLRLARVSERFGKKAFKRLARVPVRGKGE